MPKEIEAIDDIRDEHVAEVKAREKLPSEMSLRQLLDKLTDVDAQMGDLDLDLEEDLIECGAIKIDNYKYLIDKMETQVLFLKAREKEYAEARKHVENTIDRMFARVLNAMTDGVKKYQQLEGNQWKVRLHKSKAAVETKVEASAKLRVQFPDLIKAEYSWQKNAIYKAIQAGSTDLEPIASLRETVSPRFSINKEKLK